MIKQFFLILLIPAFTMLGCKKDSEQFCSPNSFNLSYELNDSAITVTPSLTLSIGGTYITDFSGSGTVSGSDSVELEFGSDFTSNAGANQSRLGISIFSKEPNSKLNQSGYYSDYNDFKLLFSPGSRSYRTTSTPIKMQVSIFIAYGQVGYANHLAYSTSKIGIMNSNSSMGTFTITNSCTLNDSGLGQVEIVEGNFSCTLYQYNGTDSLKLTKGSFVCYFKNGVL